MLLRRQPRSDGGWRLVVISARRTRSAVRPAYERASLIAHYLKTKKPRSKLILLDAKDAFSSRSCFRARGRSFTPAS